MSSSQQQQAHDMPDGSTTGYGSYYDVQDASSPGVASTLSPPAQYSMLPSPRQRGAVTPTSSQQQQRQLRNPHSDSNLSTGPLAAQAANAGTLPSLIATSPPRYLTRGSLGSVAFSPGSSPGRQTRARLGNTGKQPERIVQSNGLPGANYGHQGLGENNHDDTEHYEHFHKQSTRPTGCETSPAMMTEFDSPQLQELETHLSQTSPKTPNVGTSMQDIASSPNGSMANRRRVQPAPLDLSPPKPNWMTSNVPHPAIQDTSSQGVMSASSSLEELSAAPAAYAGLGLGLPFTDSFNSLPSTSSSMSVGDLSLSHSQLFLANGQHQPPRQPSSATSPSTQRPRQVSASAAGPSSNGSRQVRRQRSDIGPSSPESPPMIADRKGLIGLGELSTPRWTAAVHERRWGQNPMPSSPAVPMLQHQRVPEEADELGVGAHHRQESDDWQGDVLGGYTDENKENRSSLQATSDSGNYRRSMPTMDSYRSFSDIGIPPPLSARMQSNSQADESVSQSSSAYSLDALSLPDENAGSSSSSSRNGDAYSDAPDAAYYTPNLEEPAQPEFKVPMTRSSRSIASIAAQAPRTATRSASQAGRDSRESTRSTTDPLRKSQKTTQQSSSLSSQKEVPSYMRGTRASSSRRSSISSFNEVSGPSGSALPVARRARASGSNEVSTPATSRSRPSSPLRSAESSTTTILASSQAQSLGLEHARQPSASSTRSKRSIPAPINTTGARHASDPQGQLPSASEYPGGVRRGHSSKAPIAHSPSAIAHSILRSIRSSDAPPEAEVSEVAQSDEATSEAMRKLDGLGTGSTASPRMSRAYSGASMKSASTSFADVTPRRSGGTVGTSIGLSRENSKASNRTSSPHSSSSRPSSVRKSWVRGTPLPLPPASQTGVEGIQISALPMSSTRSTEGLRVVSLPSQPSGTAAGQQSPGSSTGEVPSVSFGTARRGSATTIANRPPSSSGGQHTVGIEVPHTPSASSKRSSSASLAFGAGVASTIGSRDSTSATSVSAYYGSPVAAQAGGRLSSKGNRRSSAGSDISSVHSSHAGERAEAGGVEGYELASAKNIPPVPPLPKDWESYRPSTAGDASLPNSAKDASFSHLSAGRGKDTLAPSPAYGESSLSSSRTSLDKPAGPRPLRVVSGPAAMQPRHLEENLESSVSPSLPSPTHTTQSVDADFSGLPAPSEGPNKTPTKKWSISGAFGIHRSPPMPSSSTHSSISSIISSSVDAEGRQPAHQYQSSPMSSQMPKRKLASVPDIHGLSSSHANSKSSFSGLQASQSSKSLYSASSAFSNRARTDSISSGGTAQTSQTVAAGAAPSLVATSPGRSRSSLLSPRRTPSGIPFFKRKSSSSTQIAQDPGSPKSSSSSTHKAGAGGEERQGRRSILGINLFHRSSAARKSISALPGQGIPLSPKLPKEYQNSASAVASPRADDGASEFGVRPSNESRRNSISAKASSLIGRKRGKTLPSAHESPVKPDKVNLPPMQMSALPGSPDQHATPSQKRPLPVPPRTTRLSRATESSLAKGALPTITGSPSVVNPAAGLTAEHDTSAEYSKPTTPTRIPRLAGNRSTTNSPQANVMDDNAARKQSVSPADTGERTDLPYRRGSLAPGTGFSSSAPQDVNRSLLSAKVAATPSSSSSDSMQEPANVVDQTGSSSDNTPAFAAPRSRNVSTASSQVPNVPPRRVLDNSNLPSSRSSTKTEAPAFVATTRAEKRRSLLPQQDDRDAKVARTPLKGSQPSVGSRLLSKTHSFTPSSSSTNLLTPRTRVKTSEGVLPMASSKTSNLSEGGLPTSKSSRVGLASKLSIPSRISRSATAQSLSSSPVPSEVAEGRSTSSSRYGTPIGEDEIKADEEMVDFVRRQKTRKTSHGLSEEELNRMLDFPEPIEPEPSRPPQAAISEWSKYLSEYELEEIQEYKHIYFVGQGSKKNLATKKDSTNNYGYDDERGDYLVVERDHILFRYEVIDTLGKGSFGQVLRCRDHKTGEMVAVKIIRNKKRFHHQALVEIKVLENLKRWDPDEKNCVLKIGEHFNFRGHLCITTELLSINLYELIKANSFQGFSTMLIRRFTSQILLSLSLLRHHRVVHCDLKPENILLKHPAKSAVKVIDFGSSCFENEKVYTYIQSRFYRSPEVILGMNYHMAIDMWSLGCILAELYTGYPIFPGENEASQLACIMEILGVPDKHIVDRSSRRKLFFDSTGAPRPVVDSKGRRRRPGAKTLATVLKCDDELFVDFIAKCLTWDPDRRLKPGPALRHPFCARTRNMLPAAIPPRSTSGSSRSLLKSSSTSVGISTPRRLEKRAPESVYSTPSSSIYTGLNNSSAMMPNTAPVQRTRTTSTAVHSSIGPSTSSYRLQGR